MTTLPERRQEVLRWLALGKSNSEIASILGLATGTVKRHVEELAMHYGVNGTNTRLMIVVHGIVHGDLDPDELAKLIL